MKKDFLFLKKSRWLLFTLLALFAGGMSPAWAQVTESFEFATDGETAISISEDAMKLSNGWTVVGSGSYAGIVTSGYSKTLKLQTSGARSGNCIYAGSNSAVYIVCPFEVSGTLSFFWKRNDGSGTVKIYAAEKDGETYTIGSLLATADKTTATNTSSYFEYSTDLGADPIYVAFLLNYAYLDDVTYTAYVDDGSIKKPKALTVSDVTANSAVLSWTAGGTETAWEVSYSTTSGNPDNGTIVSANVATYTLTGLTAETTYYAAVRAKDGEDVSSWTSEVSFTPTKAKALTVNDETSTNSYVPIYGSYVDYYDKVEFIIPAADLTDMAYSDIKALKFYLSSPAATSWGNANFKIYMTEVENTTVSSYTFNDDDFTALYNGSLDGTQSEMDITLTTPYSYNGGNLLVGVYNTVKGTYKSSSFYGVSATSGASAYGTNSSSLASVTTVNKQSFLPKTTFTYLPVDGPVMKVSDTAFDFGTITAESQAADKAKTFTISNKGNATLENISVSYTGDNVFSLSDGIATSIDEGGDDITVTVTMDTETPGDYSGTITVTATDQTTVEIAVSGTYAANPATMAITLGEEAVGETVAFGNVGKQATKTFTVTNSGNLKLNITSIVSSNTTDFTVSPASLEVAGGSSETFTVTFLYDENARDAEKTANITVTASNEGLVAKTFAVTGTRIEQWSEDFSGNALPDGWETTNTTYWTFADGVAKSSFSSTNYYLITPSLTVEEGASLSFEVRSVGTWNTLTIEKQLNNGSWTSCKDIASNADFGNDTETWKTFTIDGLEAGNYKFRFNARNFWLDNFEGFKRNLNDPKLGIYSDAECTIAAATSVTKDFGFATETQTATYYIKNDGTGTMTLALGDAPAGITQSLDKTSVTAGDKATLTITMPAADNKGYHGGNVVVTATDLGTFTVAASGVIVDDTKMNLNFATDNIPSTWTTNSWSKNASGYAEVGYSSSPVTMQTSNLTAVAGEDLVVVAKQSNTTSSYSFGVKYKKTTDEEWSDLIPAANIGTSYVTLHGTIAEAGTYQLQFNGQYTQIQRIYGLTEPSEPVMVVYDGESVAAATYDFGYVSDEADATWTLTVKNEGQAELTGLAAALTGDNAAHYSVEVSATTVAVDGSATVTVKQLKENLGAHAATLTISATDLDSKVITLSGNTYDHTKLFVDFEDGNLPTGWTKGSYWSVSQISSTGNRSLGHSYGSSYATSVVTTPLTVAENEVLTFGASRYYSSSAPTLKVRYTVDGGLTWSEYTDFSSEITSSYSGNTFKELTLEGVPAGTVVLEIYGSYVRLDNIYGFTATTAPMLALTESSTAVENGSTKEFGTLTAQATATYTLTNNGTAAMVSTVATTGVATAAISGEGEGVTIAENTVTLAAGKSATITLTLPYGAPYGEKSGAMTITTDGWVADFTVNYTATTVDPTALYIDFSDNEKPEGWYQDGWSFTSGYASAAYVANKQMITQKLTCAGTDDVLSFDVWPYTSSYGSYANALTVEYSADRKNWTAFADQPSFGSTDHQTFQVKGAPAGDYYVRFTGSYVYVDNIVGWHKVTGIEHDLYVSASNIPTATKIPESSITATATVYSLAADETGVTAKLFFDETEVATADAQAIALNGSANFSLTGNVPAEEKTYAAKIVVYYSDNSVAFETLTTDVEVAHTRTLAIQSFARDGEGDIDANASNQFSAAFNVTVQNTGSTAATPVVKIFVGDTQVGTATADAAVAAGESKEIAVNVTNASAGEGGNLAFTAKAYWTAEGEALATSASDVTINVTAAAPKFGLAVKEGDAVADGDAVAFGLVKAATTKTYTITNSGNKALELVSIVAPAGFEATAVTDANKTIAAAGTLDIDVTLQAVQGKVSGDLVFTYKVDAMTNKTFTLALSGRSVSEDTWTVAFNDYSASIPADWTNNGWSVAGEYNDYPGAAYTYTASATLMTPRLHAANGEELTFDVVNNYYNTATYAYSTDKTTWSEEVTISGTGEKSFIAPAEGDYYIRFTGRGAYLQNFVGFQLNPLEHETEITASSVPTTGTQYAVYTATVTLKENAGKDEAITAELYVNGAKVEEATADVTEVAKNASTVVTLTWTPQTAITEAVKAYVKVTYAGGDLTTDEVDLTIAEPYTLDETVGTVESGTFASIVLKRTFVEGWNTVCLPFTIDVAAIDANAVAFNFAGYNTETKELTFDKVTELTASYPYVVYVPENVTADKVFNNVTNDTYAFKNTSGDVTFQGTYTPVTFSDIEGDQYGLTATGEIKKASATATMKGFRAYFTGVPAGARVKFMGFDDDELTGIRMITVDQSVEGVFNLQGQKIEQLKKGGLYIINGKKQVVK